MITKPCVFCGIRLKPVFKESGWETNQPINGGEVCFFFSYGSEKFDKKLDTTEYRGLICDYCAEKYVGKMEEIT